MTYLRSTDLFDRGPIKGWLPWGVLAPFLGLAFVVASQLAGIPLIAPLVALDPLGNPLDALALFAYTLVPFGLLGLVVLAWVRFVERRSFASIGLRGDSKPKVFAWGHAIGMLSILGIVASLWLADGLHRTGEPTAWSSHAWLASIGLLLIGFAVQSSVEELLFRGWLFSVLAKKFSVLVGVIVSSLLFALLHFSRGEPWLVNVCDLAFGVFACAWALRYRSILGVMGWHAGWNWLMAVGFGLPLTGIDVGTPALLVDLQAAGPAWLTGGAEGPEGSVVCLAYCVLATAWLLLWPKHSEPAKTD
ncbi:MAG: type II CAAX endopeptidase family protein [Pseudomonadota bacterium]